jgi:hypothetical protein
MCPDLRSRISEMSATDHQSPIVRLANTDRVPRDYGDAFCIASEYADLLVATAKAAQKREAVRDEIKATANRAAEEITQGMHKAMEFL